MPERKQMATVTVVTDDDTGMYHVGEPDGLFQQEELLEYLRMHGQKGKSEMLEHLAYMQFQILETWRIVNRAENCKAASAD